MKIEIRNNWLNKIEAEINKRYFHELIEFVDQEYKNHKCFPPENSIFAAFDYASFEAVKVVIVGQDPYHGENQANGLCFSVNEGVKIPPSLDNIFKERKFDLGIPIPISGNLEHWAKQGVLMLNSTLSVRSGLPGSHQNKGWEVFTDSILKLINKEKQNIVFVLWGAFAQKKEVFLDESRHLIIKSAHPSPFSVTRGFFGSKPFSKANSYLKSNGHADIEW